MHTSSEPIRASITAALMRGAKFIVNANDQIIIQNPGSIPPVDRDRLRQHWQAARAEILSREHQIRTATPYLCPECGNEVARWIGNNIWLPGFHMGWGERGWVNQGQAIPIINCKECRHRWWVEYQDPMHGRL